MSWGGDVDAMTHLADRLDGAARQLNHAVRLVGSVVVDDGAACVAPGSTISLSVLADTAAWASHQAADVRRRARLLDEADAERRRLLQDRIDHSDYDPHPGFFDHIRRVGHAGLTGLWEGVRAPVAGMAALGGVVKESVVAPAQVAGALAHGDLEGAWDAAAEDVDVQNKAMLGAAGGVLSSVRQTAMLAPGIQPLVLAERWHRDGFWRAAEDTAHDSGEAAPGAALMLVPGGEVGAGLGDVVVGQVKSVSTAASALSGLGAASSWGATDGDREVLELAVPVDVRGQLVAYDYRNGDFLVARPGGDDGNGVRVERHRWSRLDSSQRDALRHHGVVDAHGRPISSGG
jgi:hypothetical protein